MDNRAVVLGVEIYAPFNIFGSSTTLLALATHSKMHSSIFSRREKKKKFSSQSYIRAQQKELLHYDAHRTTFLKALCTAGAKFDHSS